MSHPVNIDQSLGPEEVTLTKFECILFQKFHDLTCQCVLSRNLLKIFYKIALLNETKDL